MPAASSPVPVRVETYLYLGVGVEEWSSRKIVLSDFSLVDCETVTDI